MTHSAASLDRAADVFTRCAADLRALTRPWRDVLDEGVVTGGVLWADLDAMATDAGVRCAHYASRLDELAAQCRARAELARLAELAPAAPTFLPR